MSKPLVATIGVVTIATLASIGDDPQTPPPTPFIPQNSITAPEPKPEPKTEPEIKQTIKTPPSEVETKVEPTKPYITPIITPPAPTPITPPKPTSSCDPNYSGCVPIASDVDCEGGSGNGPAYTPGPVRVIGTDIYGLDRDKDGYGCE